MTPFDASIRGAHEIALPVVAMTITLAAVYAPIGFVSGVTGALFREFAFTLAGAVIVSGFIALTLSPMMCSKLLRHEPGPAVSARSSTAPSRDCGTPISVACRAVEFPCADAADPGRRAGDDRGYVSVDAARTGPGGGSGLSDHVIKAPQLANRDYVEQATQRLYSEARTAPELAHVFLVNGYPNVRSGFVGLLLSPGISGRATRSRCWRPSDRNSSPCRKRRCRPSRRRRCRARPAARRCNSSSAPPATTRRSPTSR